MEIGLPARDRGPGGLSFEVAVHATTQPSAWRSKATGAGTCSCIAMQTPMLLWGCGHVSKGVQLPAMCINCVVMFGSCAVVHHLAKQTKKSRNKSSVSATGETPLGQDNTYKERGRRKGTVLQTCWLIADYRSGIKLPQGLWPCLVRNATVHLHAGWEVRLTFTV
mgnify:CR=1 FL=1